MSKKIEVTQAEYDKIADEFIERHTGHTSSLAHAMQLVTQHMSQYKIIKKKSK